MSKKSQKQHRKEILRDLRRQQQAEAEAKMPLKKAELKALFDWVDERLATEGCDRTLRHVETLNEANNLETTLETERLRLEPLRERHAEYLFPLLTEPQIYTFIPQDPPRSLAELQTRYKQLETRHSPEGDELWLNWAIYLKTEKQYVGSVEATIGGDNIGYLAYQLSPRFWGFGYATEACRQIINTLFTEYRVTEITAEVDTRNVASYKLLERLSFERVRLKAQADFFKGAYSDEYVYRLRQQGWLK